MKNSTNTIGHKTAWAFLLILIGANVLSASINKISEDSLRLGNSTLNIKPHVMFSRADVSGTANMYDFVDGTMDKIRGVRNFKDGMLPANEAFIFNEISVGFSTGVVAIPGGVEYVTKLPNSLKNAEFAILQGNREVLNMPFSALANPAALGANNGDQWVQLGSLAYLSDDAEFTWRITYPLGQETAAGTPAGSDFSYLEIQLRGYKSSKKA